MSNSKKNKLLSVITLLDEKFPDRNEVYFETIDNLIKKEYVVTRRGFSEGNLVELYYSLGAIISYCLIGIGYSKEDIQDDDEFVWGVTRYDNELNWIEGLTGFTTLIELSSIFLKSKDRVDGERLVVEFLGECAKAKKEKILNNK